MANFVCNAVSNFPAMDFLSTPVQLPIIGQDMTFMTGYMRGCNALLSGLEEGMKKKEHNYVVIN